jgi:hypothetical protein
MQRHLSQHEAHGCESLAATSCIWVASPNPFTHATGPHHQSIWLMVWLALKRLTQGSRNLGEPTHTIVSCWMPKPSTPRNQHTGWFAPTRVPLYILSGRYSRLHLKRGLFEASFVHFILFYFINKEIKCYLLWTWWRVPFLGHGFFQVTYLAHPLSINQNTNKQVICKWMVKSPATNCCRSHRHWPNFLGTLACFILLMHKSLPINK